MEPHAPEPETFHGLIMLALFGVALVGGLWFIAGSMVRDARFHARLRQKRRTRQQTLPLDPLIGAIKEDDRE